MIVRADWNKDCNRKKREEEDDEDNHCGTRITGERSIVISYRLVWYYTRNGDNLCCYVSSFYLFHKKHVVVVGLPMYHL
jgi:hypothetical protein